MSNFNCEKCGLPILEGKNGYYITECVHYPIENLKELSMNSANEILNQNEETTYFSIKSRKYRNVKVHKDSKSGYKGVVNDNGIWRSRIMVNGKTISIGAFSTKKDAAKAYNETAIKYHGEFARLNDVK